MLVTKFYLMFSLRPGAKISLFCGEKGGIFQVKDKICSGCFIHLAQLIPYGISFSAWRMYQTNPESAVNTLKIDEQE
ncbi:MAG: hypothetical protein PX637_12395, partial [Microcystis sp. M53601_WE4]|jgi:hypothetical protein|nr:hypothetical protein [Microcystis sp. M53601_WE4]